MKQSKIKYIAGCFLEVNITEYINTYPTEHRAISNYLGKVYKDR